MKKRFLLPLLLAVLLAACARQPAGAPEETSAPVETLPESAAPFSGTGEAIGDGDTFTANGQIRFRPDTRTEGEKAESFFSVRRTEN